MRRIIFGITILAVFASCKNQNKNLSYDSKPASEKEEQMEMPPSHGMKPKVEVQEIELNKAKDITDIAEIFAYKTKFEGKILKVMGVVTKFNADILGKNWLHLQDGTNYEGKYDFSANSNEKFIVGDTVVIEGTLTLDKDLGAGYFYEVILEDCVKK